MSVSQPSPQQQLQFLSNLQRLFSEGSFVATYKFALLSALADLCIEMGEDTNAELTIPTRKIAEKFITFYWRQSRPFLPKGREVGALILRQNTGREAGVIRLLRQQLDSGINSLNQLQQDQHRWATVVTEVDVIIRQMPLWKLQTVGRSVLEFLYPNKMNGNSVQLKAGVMFCFRAFHSFITDMTRGAWIRYIRRYNQTELGDPADLDEFLFGSERVSLAAYVPILRDLQSSKCFYCRRKIQPTANHVDHFIPWSIYPVNLGHNFVLADSRCNAAKSDHLAAYKHLQEWCGRNRDFGSQLGREFDRAGIVHNVRQSATVANWAYGRAFALGAETFVAPDIFERLPQEWQKGW
jgi:hypothetical protein